MIRFLSHYQIFHVERAFGLMKTKWWLLKFVDVFLIENAHTLIMVEACLHNFGIIFDYWIEDAPPIVREPIIDVNDMRPYVSHKDEEDIRIGYEKRRIMAEEII